MFQSFPEGEYRRCTPEAALERIEYRFSWKGKGLTNDDLQRPLIRFELLS